MGSDSMEATVARLDERIKGISIFMEQLTKDQERVAAAYEKLVESNQRVALLEADMVSVKTGHAKLWEKYDVLNSSFAASEKKRIEDELKAKNKWIGEVGKAMLTAGVTALLFYLGIHQA